MPRKATTTTNTAIIADEAFGEFAVSDYQERLYAKVFYAIRERQGYLSRKSLGESFDWQTFKAKFAEIFGTPEQRKFSLEQLLNYAMQKFGMTQEQLIEANNKSWQRRRNWEAQQTHINPQTISTLANNNSLAHEDIPY